MTGPVQTGSTRDNVSALRDRLDERRADPRVPGLSADLFAASSLIGSEPLLRTTLADAGQATQARVGTVRSLFSGQVSELAVDVLADVAAQRWSGQDAMVDTIEQLGAQAAFMSAEQEGTLDRVEDELFQFSAALKDSAELQLALTDPALTSDAKSSLVESLLSGRAAPQTSQVVSYTLSHLRGRRAQTALEDLIDLAAEQRGRSVADVRVARPLDPDQAERLARALSRIHGRRIRLNVAVDPGVLGGISVRVGDQVVDATMQTRVEQARRALAG